MHQQAAVRLHDLNVTVICAAQVPSTGAIGLSRNAAMMAGAQRVFYLPCQRPPDDAHIVFLDQVLLHPTAVFMRNEEKRRLFTLSQSPRAARY